MRLGTWGWRLGVLLVLVATAGAIGLARQDGSGSVDLSAIAAKFGVERYAPGPEESDSLAGLETFWSDRVTYPTGRFDSRWLLNAQKQEKLVREVVPLGAKPTNANSPEALSASSWTFLGPQPQESDPGVCNGLCFSFGRVAGRVNAIALDPTTTTPGQMTAYFGSDGGGVWKSTNCCNAATLWAPTTDGGGISTTSVSDLFVDPSNRWVYVATGDISFGSFAFGSAGVLRSKDQGASWEVLGSGVFTPLLPSSAGSFPQYQAISKVETDPNRRDTVVAATKTGLFFSYDSGVNWSGPCYTNSFNDQRQDVTDMLLVDVGADTKLYAAVGARGFATTVQPNLGKNGANGIYTITVPTGGGCPSVGSWTLSSVPGVLPNGWPGGTGTGVPCDPPPGNTALVCPATTNRLGRIELAVAPSTVGDADPAVHTVYAVVQAVDTHPSAAEATPCGVLIRTGLVSNSPARGCFYGLWRTTDAGATWTQRANTADLFNLATAGPCGEDTPQNWYNEALAVDPTNPDVLFMDAIDIWKSTNGGDTLTDVSCGYYTGLITNPVHVDNQELVYAPPVAGVANTLLAGNDGGIYVSVNAANVPNPAQPGLGNPPTFTEINNTVGTIEFYSGDISAGFATSATPTIVAGAQDNGSSSFQWPGFPAIGCPQCNWQQRIGGDGMYARIEPKQGLRTYLESQNGNIRVSTTGHAGVYSGSCGLVACSPSWPWAGDRKSFVFPYELDKFDCTHNNPSTTTCDHIIAGSYRVWESVLGGGVTAAGLPTGWYINSPDLTKGTLADRSYINQLAYAPQDNRVAIVGTNDGNVQLGFNMGAGAANTASWVDVTNGNAVLPNRPILDVAIAPNNPVVAGNLDQVTAYAAVGGFNENSPGAPGHVFQLTCNAGCTTATWADKTGNLPNIPVDAIAVNPKVPGMAFAGTDWGFFFTNDITAPSPIWGRYHSGGLPNTMIWDFAIDRGTGADPITSATTLVAFTRGRGAWAWLLPSGPIVPTAVWVASFDAKARGTGKGVGVAWRTAAETDTLGFNVWRFTAGRAAKVNRTLIRARGGSRGTTYRLVDRAVRTGRHTYRLQAVDLSGKRSWRGTATVRTRS